MKISKTYVDKSKRKPLSLHKRIENFRTTHPREADLLMAIKWIGNSGSHTNEPLTKDDILDGFEILDHVTISLYETESIRINKLSKKINQRKKPIGKSASKKK